MQQKRDHFIELMKQQGLICLTATAVILFVQNMIDQNEADKDFAIRITKEFGVATIPVSVFYKAEQTIK
jgi:methionine aminotransferase